MTLRLTLASTLAAVIAFGVTSDAVAQTDVEAEGTPYAITFHGSYYPAYLEDVEYPFTAASMNRDGECLLNVMTDDAGQIAAMTILNCTNDMFQSEAENLIKRQETSGPVPTALTAHTLRITWDIGADIDPTPLQLAIR